VTDSVSQDIASFLLARISEGEREMRDAVDFNEADRAEVGDVFYAEWGYRDPGTWRGIAGRSADLASKRRIVERYIYLADNGDSGDARWVLPLLALPYGEHPDFDPAWTVED